jgi:hypothetical protein
MRCENHETETRSIPFLGYGSKTVVSKFVEPNAEHFGSCLVSAGALRVRTMGANTLNTIICQYLTIPCPYRHLSSAGESLEVLIDAVMPSLSDRSLSIDVGQEHGESTAAVGGV